MLDTNIVYRGYITRDPYEAFEAYKESLGFEPRSLVIRPGYQITRNHPLLIESRHGAYGVILVTHQVSTKTGDEKKEEEDPEPEEEEEEPRPMLYVVDNLGDIIKISKKSRQKSEPVTCPHCKQNISQNRFNDLGYWYGWREGKEPPYWDSLRRYIFRRDDYICSDCHEKFPIQELRCHHIVPKEIGGTDSARNLITMCDGCHPDDKPIFDD